MKRLSGSDAMLLYSETPNVYTHTLKVAVVESTSSDNPFSFETFKEIVRQRLDLMEPLRYRLVQTPLRLHHPMWLQGCDVDLDYHLRKVEVADPGGRRELDELVGLIAGSPLDRSRPLWEFYFVEGLAGGCSAVVGKVHHTLADGVASGNMMARAMNHSAHAAAARREPVTAESLPSKAAMLGAAGRDHLHQIGRLPRLIGHTAAGLARQRSRSKSRGEHPGLASGLRAPQTFINHVVSPRRTFATATLALTDVKHVSKILGITINDLLLAICAGALRELLIRYDGHAELPLIASVPTCLDMSMNRISGNELGGLLVSLPVQVADPLERTRLVDIATGVAKENYLLVGPDLMANWSMFLPTAIAPSVFRWLSKRKPTVSLFNLPISNVPGPRERSGLGAFSLREIYSVGPLVAGSGLNITAWSYVDQFNISVLADDATLRDPHEVTNAMLRAFRDIRCSAGLPGEISTVDTAMDQVCPLV
ncbi:WS/DGAT/MGAT family O-acyltransferase [Mycobacterium sp.]|uniref:WS/DGAT/MGAT family O-acyltransferase n=1 Tax=Mycobacterium sp. TaxID=1785 RepID=UPI003D0A3BCB